VDFTKGGRLTLARLSVSQSVFSLTPHFSGVAGEDERRSNRFNGYLAGQQNC